MNAIECNWMQLNACECKWFQENLKLTYIWYHSGTLPTSEPMTAFWKEMVIYIGPQSYYKIWINIKYREPAQTLHIVVFRLPFEIFEFCSFCNLHILFWNNLPKERIDVTYICWWRWFVPIGFKAGVFKEKMDMVLIVKVVKVKHGQLQLIQFTILCLNTHMSYLYFIYL